MIIKRMHASFGKLSEQTLELQDGLNVITLPNEAGKSTWTEFLLAMLYGVDTREKRRQGYLPIKEKYRPWQGGGMQGSMTLVRDGKTITLERSGTERAPMAQLRAYETTSGLPVELPEGEACGRLLVDAERSVYERSGFLRQQRHALTQDPALSSRLAALVTTGDERYAYPELERKLREQRNRCRSNKRNGLIPETEAALDEVRAQLAETYELQRQLTQAEAELPAAERELAHWQEQERLCALFEAERRRRRLEQAERDLEEERRQLETMTAQCASLPDERTLRDLLERIDETSAALSRAQAEQAGVPHPEQPPWMPPALQGLREEEAKRRAEEDLARLSGLAKECPQPRRPLLFAALIALLVGAGLLAAGLFVPLTALTVCGGVLLLGGAAAGFGYLRTRRVCRALAGDAARQMQAIAETYGATPQTVKAAAEQRLTELHAYEERERERQERLRQTGEALAAWERKRDALLAETDAFGPQTADLPAARGVAANALAGLQMLERQKEQVQTAERHAEDLRAMLGTLPPAQTVPEGTLPPDPRQVQLALAQAQSRLQAAQSGIDRLSGRLGAAEDALTLEARRDRLQTRLTELQEKLSALELASQVLCEANDELQARFSPLVCTRAGELFSRLTDGRYERLSLDAEMNVTVWETGASVGRSLEWLSEGTADQLYLALRLAISELLLPEAPLVLDDALVAFDDERTARALRVLAELAKKRQILLFTCQGREARILAAES